MLEKYRSLDPFVACWIEDSTPREFKDELIQSGKGHRYVGEWSPESNQWHGYGVAVYSNSHMYIGYFKQGRRTGLGRYIGITGQEVVYFFEGWHQDDLKTGLGK